MSGKNLLSVLLITIFANVGCAQPKYVSPEDHGNNPQTVQENQTACNNPFKATGYCLSWTWEKQPSSSETGTFTFKIYRLNSLDQTAVMVDLPENPGVVLWMPMMGHGSSPVTVERLDAGTYRASNVFFVMPGEWQIKFQLKEASAVVDESIVEITL